MNRIPGLKYQYEAVLAEIIAYGGLCLSAAVEHKVPMVAEFDGYCVALYPDQGQFRLHPIYLDLTNFPHIDMRYHLGSLVDVAGNGDITKAIDSYNRLEDSIDVSGYEKRFIKNIKSLN